MTHFRSAPTFDQDILAPNPSGAKTTASWYRFFQDLSTGTPPAAETPITVNASPFIYQAMSMGQVIISGGTVSDISYSRTPGVFYSTGQTSGVITLSANDVLKVTYSVIPTMTFMPS
jgi:hypothetical protein